MLSFADGLTIVARGKFSSSGYPDSNGVEVILVDYNDLIADESGPFCPI